MILVCFAISLINIMLSVIFFPLSNLFSFLPVNTKIYHTTHQVFPWFHIFLSLFPASLVVCLGRRLQLCPHWCLSMLKGWASNRSHKKTLKTNTNSLKTSLPTHLSKISLGDIQSPQSPDSPLITFKDRKQWGPPDDHPEPSGLVLDGVLLLSSSQLLKRSIPWHLGL